MSNLHVILFCQYVDLVRVNSLLLIVQPLSSTFFIFDRSITYVGHVLYYMHNKKLLVPNVETKMAAISKMAAKYTGFFCAHHDKSMTFAGRLFITRRIRNYW